jgi:hypothetical protein
MLDRRVSPLGGGPSHHARGKENPVAKLIAVPPAKAKAARAKMERLVAKDLHFQKQMAEMEHFATAVKKRRDAEHARKQAEDKGGQK